MYNKFYHGLNHAKDFSSVMVIRCFFSKAFTYVKTTSGGKEIYMMRNARKYIINVRKYNNITVWWVWDGRSLAG
jgi:hypothetical protein